MRRRTVGREWNWSLCEDIAYISQKGTIHEDVNDGKRDETATLEKPAVLPICLAFLHILVSRVPTGGRVNLKTCSEISTFGLDGH